MDSRIFMGLKREPRVGWKLAEAPRPTTRTFSNKTPSSLDLMSASSRLKVAYNQYYKILLDDHFHTYFFMN
jgi:hypothetical protein